MIIFLPKVVSARDDENSLPTNQDFPMLITIAQRGQTRNLGEISMEAPVPRCKSRNRARNPFSGHYDALLGLCSQMCLESLQDWLLEPCQVQNPND